MTATHSTERPDKTASFHSYPDIADAKASDAHTSNGSRPQPGNYVESLWFVPEQHIAESGTPLEIDHHQSGNAAEGGTEKPIEFAHPWEEEFANLLDARNVQWRYKPRTFAVEWDEDGNFVDCFTPDFYLVANETYIALITAGRGESNAKIRNVRLLRRQHPEIRLEVITSPYRLH